MTCICLLRILHHVSLCPPDGAFSRNTQTTPPVPANTSVASPLVGHKKMPTLLPPAESQQKNIHPPRDQTTAKLKISVYFVNPMSQKNSRFAAAEIAWHKPYILLHEYTVTKLEFILTAGFAGFGQSRRLVPTGMSSKFLMSFAYLLVDTIYLFRRRQ
ncbi:hypothetical protein V1506DRAFT_534145 [Lipomyces tetrasporus]